MIYKYAKPIYKMLIKLILELNYFYNLLIKLMEKLAKC
jgi:hypothetical protein